MSIFGVTVVRTRVALSYVLGCLRLVCSNDIIIRLEAIPTPLLAESSTTRLVGFGA